MAFYSDNLLQGEVVCTPCGRDAGWSAPGTAAFPDSKRPAGWMWAPFFNAQTPCECAQCGEVCEG